MLAAVHDATHDGTIGVDDLDGLDLDALVGARRARRIRSRKAGPDQRTTVLFVGDHDPSGIDLERDVRAKLDLYGAAGLYVLERIAVTCTETCEANEPELHSNPANDDDSRWSAYCDAHHTDQA